MENETQLSWSDLGLSSELLKLIEEAGYQRPTPVQAQSIPYTLAGNDVLASSQTGSGKTASFVLPTVERFRHKNGTYILALSPTREIAQQTGAVFETFAAPFGMKVAVCIGGASMAAEKEMLASSPHIIVATPGRLCDHLERGHVWLEFIQCLIFDEADRMLEMGFAKQIDTITEQISKDRQTLMFSATFAPQVEKLARRSMREPKEVVIKKTVDTAPKIDQRLYWLSEEKKLSQLLRLLRHEEGTMFVFVKAKERAYQVWRNLQSAGFESATYIHSDLPQDAREQAVADFKAGKYRVIVATDVMGRGIDVDEVAHVVNYDVPREPEDYIHRIGRTGRRGLEGKASTFAIPGKDDKLIEAIGKVRGVAAPRPDAERPARGESKRGPRREREQDNTREARPRRSGPRPPRHDKDQPRKPRPPRDGKQGRPSEQMAQVQKPAAATPVQKPGLLSRIKSFLRLG